MTPDLSPLAPESLTTTADTTSADMAPTLPLGEGQGEGFSGGDMASPARTPLPLGEGQGEGACLSQPRTTNHEPRTSLASPSSYATASSRLSLVTQFDALLQTGCSTAAAARQLRQPHITLWRWHRTWKQAIAAGRDPLDALLDRTHLCGRKPKIEPTAAELAVVRSIYLRLDESEARGQGLGSSKIAAWRIASRDPQYAQQLSPDLRAAVLDSGKRRVPPALLRALDLPANVLANHRDKRTTTSAYISTPRGREIIDQHGQTVPLRAGHIFEADDGTINFYAYIPWPFGGDPCSEKFGVKLARWQLLATVDVASLMCVAFDLVCRPSSAYRAEDSAALIGRTMTEVGVPSLWRLERGSWESHAVRDALKACGVPVHNAWHSKQKAAVENFFDRLWTPASLIPGHVGRDRDRFKDITSIALACQDGRRDPRDYFLPLTSSPHSLTGSLTHSSLPAPRSALQALIRAIEFTNTEPVESRAWGRWIPQERFTQHTADNSLATLDPRFKIFFAREQRIWTVRKATLGGSVNGPLISFPIYFQHETLWEFEACQVRCYFDPYTDPCLGTLVLVNPWRDYPAGHIIARDVPALDLPPQANLSGETLSTPNSQLLIRKALAKAVRTEMWSWLGHRASRARDGLGNETHIVGGAGGAMASPARTVPASRPSPHSLTDPLTHSTADGEGSCLAEPRTTNHEPRTTSRSTIPGRTLNSELVTQNLIGSGTADLDRLQRQAARAREIRELAESL